MSVVAIDQVADMLANRAAELAAELLPGGKRDGREWRCGSIAGEPGKSMAVAIHGSRAGVWSDFGSGERGDALDLVAMVLFAGRKGDALRWSRRWLGLDSGDTAALATNRREAERRAAQTEAEAGETRQAAFAMWLGAQNHIAGTPVESYLAGRGIDLAELGRQPRALRYHPALWNRERDAKLPAMVAAVSGTDGRHVATHRTWLEDAGAGDWRKASVTKPKMVLGGFASGSIRLWRGSSGKPLADAPMGEIVDITEGIEDGLTVAMALPECRVLAAVSLSNMGRISLPVQIRTVRLWRQNDSNPKAVAQFEGVLAEFEKRGISALIPPIPDNLKDVNDLLQHPGGHHGQG